MEEGNISGKAVCIPSYESTPLALKGIGLPRLDLIKKNEFTWTVKNSSDEPCRVSFMGGQGWEMPPEMQIPGHGERSVIFQPSRMEAGQHEARGESLVNVSDGISKKEIRLPAPHPFVPIAAEPLSPGGIGTVMIGSKASVCFRLRNDSEFPKQIRWSAFSGSGGAVTQTPLDLKSRESREVSFDWSPSRPGSALLKVEVEDGVERSEILWNAYVIEPPAVPRRIQGTPLISDIKMVQNQGAEVKLPLLKKTSITPTLPPAPQVEALEYGIRTNWIGMTTPYLQWDLQGEKLSSIQVEHRREVPPIIEEIVTSIQESKKFPPRNYQYIPMTGFHHKKEGDREVVLLSQLFPGPHLLTLTVLNEDGQTRARSDFQLNVPERRSNKGAWRMTSGILGVLFLMFLWRYR